MYCCWPGLLCNSLTFGKAISPFGLADLTAVKVPKLKTRRACPAAPGYCRKLLKLSIDALGSVQLAQLFKEALKVACSDSR